MSQDGHHANVAGHHHGEHSHGDHGHAHHHHPHHPHRAIAMAPTFSLLRLSAWQRLIGLALALGVLWLLVFAVLGQGAP